MRHFSMALAMAAAIFGCAGRDSSPDIREELPEPNDTDYLSLGTGGTHSIAGSCVGGDEDGFAIAGDGSPVATVSLAVSWQSDDGSLSAVILDADPGAGGGVSAPDTSVEVTAGSAEGGARLVVACFGETIADYHGEFGVGE